MVAVPTAGLASGTLLLLTALLGIWQHGPGSNRWVFSVAPQLTNEVGQIFLMVVLCHSCSWNPWIAGGLRAEWEQLPPGPAGLELGGSCFSAEQRYLIEMETYKSTFQKEMDMLFTVRSYKIWSPLGKTVCSQQDQKVVVGFASILAINWGISAKSVLMQNKHS